MDEQTRYKMVRQRVEKRHKERNGLIIRIVVFVLVNVLLVQVRHIAIVPVFLIWGTVLLVQFLSYQSRYGEWGRRREVAIQREVEQELARMDTLYGNDEKPKRDRLRLTDDGEIEPVDSHDLFDKKPKRNRLALTDDGELEEIVDDEDEAQDNSRKG